MSHAPGNQTMQLMPMQIYQHSFWTGLWLLQQTPPVPHLIYRLVLLAGGWPFRTAEILCAMQGIISLLAGVLLCSMIRRLVNSNAIALLFSLWFLLSTDLLVTEYAFYGQMFYEDLGMLGTLACCWQACRLAQRNDADTITNSGLLGTLAALTALTRSSLNFFPLAILPGAVMFLRTRSIVALVLPILVLQGGWAAKNWVALNRFTMEDSNWTGMNMAKGVFWANQDLLILKDIADAPSGIYPPWFQAIGHHYTFPFEVSKRQSLPPSLVKQDEEMTDRLGYQAPWNLPSVAAESDAWRTAVVRFTKAHPLLFLQHFRKGYEFLWQRIADHSALFAWNLLYVEPVDRPFPGLLSRGFSEKQQVALNPLGVGAQPGREANLGTISLAPLDALSILALHFLLPLLVVVDCLRRRRRKSNYLSRGVIFLIPTALYGLLVFSIGDGGENMRFRLSIEPVIIALKAVIFVGLWRAFYDMMTLYRTHLRITERSSEEAYLNSTAGR